MRSALTIAGSDPSGGAGAQADLKTFAAHGVYGLCALTAITAQNTLGVRSSAAVAPELVTAQIEAVVSDVGVDAAKTGMLATAAIVEAVATAVAALDIPALVVDPVLAATRGGALVEPDAVAVMRSRLLPRAWLVTPNVPEAEALAGIPVSTERDRREAARRILALGPARVLITGGHLATPDISDLLYDGHEFLEFHTPRVTGRDVHGTGCTFAAAITAQLALERPLEDAIPEAQRYVAGAIRASPDLGRGQRLLNHFWHRSR